MFGIFGCYSDAAAAFCGRLLAGPSFSRCSLVVRLLAPPPMPLDVFVWPAQSCDWHFSLSLYTSFLLPSTYFLVCAVPRRRRFSFTWDSLDDDASFFCFFLLRRAEQHPAPIRRPLTATASLLLLLLLLLSAVAY